jgi:hypothetical protein
MQRIVVLIFAAATLAGCATTPGDGVRQGYFFVGGRYVEGKTGPLMERQMYVECTVTPLGG